MPHTHLKGVGSGCRIVLTGGPGGGKTTAADLFRREIGDEVVIVPEAATLLFSGGFPRDPAPLAQRAAQLAIYHVQKNLEDAQAARYPGRILLCDRGTVDGAAYWPGPGTDYFRELGTTLEAEFARYDAVIFFESAAVGGIGIEGGNLVRNENLATAAALDTRLRELWCRHPRYILVPHSASFLDKVSRGVRILESLVQEFRAGRTCHPA
jgi:hypothetical protein